LTINKDGSLKVIRFFTAVAASMALMLPPLTHATAAKVAPQEARAIAKQAYIYGFPMVVHYKTMVAYVLDE
jgi:hypothetical protein